MLFLKYFDVLFKSFFYLVLPQEFLLYLHLIHFFMLLFLILFIQEVFHHHIQLFN